MMKNFVTLLLFNNYSGKVTTNTPMHRNGETARKRADDKEDQGYKIHRKCKLLQKYFSCFRNIKSITSNIIMTKDRKIL